MNEWEISSDIFVHPFTCMIAGPTQCGKTRLVFEILKNNPIMISPPLDNIIYCYSEWQEFFDSFSSINPPVKFHSGLPDISELNSSQKNLVILDDLMSECQSDASISHLFTVDSHHKNTSVIFLTQNLFSQGKYCRSISLNSHYLIVFHNPRDKQQINVLARQLFPNKSAFFIEAFEDSAESKPYGYIFIDLKQSTDNKNRIQSNILPGQQRIIYTSK